MTVHFKLKAADVEQNNVKGEKRFFLPVLEGITWDANPPLPSGERAGVRSTLTIPFEFRPLTPQEQIAYGQKNQQEAILAKALEAIPKRLPKGAHEALAALTAEKRRTEKGEAVTHLEHHLRRYTRRNTSDFFIHKDLRGFLSRELDFYLKNEVLNLDELEAAGEGLAEGWFQLMRLIKRIGLRIIEFLAQIEDFQKMLWEKRKFITETFYVITVGNIPEAFYPEIAACEAQWAEWKILYGIEIPPLPVGGEGRGEGVKSRTKAERSALITQLAREMRKASTDAENRLWQFVRDRRLGGYKFRRQHPIDRYIVDYICIERRLIVELDGGQHAGAKQRERDEERERFFENRGFRVLRFWSHEVLKNTEGVLETILDALEKAPHPNPLPPGERESFLKAHPALPLDTRHFSADFVDRLLASFDPSTGSGQGLDEMTDGLLVHSENWQALNLLQEKYRERVKCVYIDPPYNTGSDGFLYKDSYQHSSWLSAMAERIRLSAGYLESDACLFVSIDDIEFAGLKYLLSHALGSDSLVSELVWKKRSGGDMTAGRGSRLSVDHDYVVAVLKSGGIGLSGLPIDESKYSNPDNDPDGPWTTADLTCNKTAEERPNLFYDLVDPATGNVFKCNPKRVWAYEPERMNEFIGRTVDGRWLPKVLSPSDPNRRPQLKVFLKERKASARLISSWLESVGANARATQMLDSIIGGRVVIYPKPIELIILLAAQCTPNKSGVILDFFAGSGTTGHAVINLNREDGGRRKFILVEMAEYFDTVLLPRIKKITFSPEWKDGRPLTPALSPLGRGQG